MKKTNAAVSPALSRAGSGMFPVYLAYGSSEIACQPIFTMLMSFIVYFYTDVIGLDAEKVGAIVLISRLIDGLTDLFSGKIVDNTKSRFGHARPWYLWLSLPLAAAFVLLYTVPNGPDTLKYAYVFLTYNLLAGIVYTLMNAAMVAFPILLSERREDRSVMMSVRYFIASCLQFIIMLATLRIVESLGGGRAGWIRYAAIMAAVAVVTLLTVFAVTREKHTGSEPGAAENVPAASAFKALIRNKYWIIAILTQLTFSLLQIAMISGNVYYAKYVLNDLSMQETMSLFNYIPSILTCLVLSFLLNRRGVSKRKLSLLFDLLIIAGSLLIFFFESGTFLILGLALRGIGYAAINVLISGMAIETAVYGEWKTGVSIPGMTVTSVGVGQKLGFGLGTALFGIILGACGYNGTAAVQPDTAVSAIRISFTVAPFVLALILALLLYLFKLDYEYPVYERELAQRKGTVPAEK